MGKKNLDGIRPNTEHKWEDDLPLYKFDKPDYQQFRLVGDVFALGRHWVATKPDDIEGGKKFPRECPNFSDEKEDHSLPNGCPACERAKSAPAKSISSSRHYLINAIDRSAQSDGRKNPIVVLGPLPVTVVDEIAKLKKLNKERGATDGHHVTDPVQGRDVMLRYNASSTPKWSVQLDPQGKSPLNAEETKYRLYDIGSVYPNFNDVDVREAYNSETLRSLTRCGYFKDDEEGNEPAVSSDTASFTRGSRAKTTPQAAQAEETESPSDPVPIQNLVRRTTTPAQTEAAFDVKPVVKQGAPVTAATPTCPSPDEDHRFGNFMADPICMKCPLKMRCITATENNGDSASN